MAKALDIEFDPREGMKELRAARTRKRLAVGRAMQATVKAAHSDMQRMLSGGSPSSPGGPPGRLTGKYRSSWKMYVHPSGLGGKIFTEDGIAHLLEYGTKTAAARPHRGPLAQKSKAPFVRRVRQEVARG